MNPNPNRYRSTALNAFVIGVTFGFAWTPCIGPVLASILFFATQATTASVGAGLLFFFGLGIAVPFLLIALFIDHIASWLRRLNRLTVIVQRVAGAFLIAVGLLMLLNHYQELTSWTLRVLPFRPAL